MMATVTELNLEMGAAKNGPLIIEAQIDKYLTGKVGMAVSDCFRKKLLVTPSFKTFELSDTK